MPDQASEQFTDEQLTEWRRVTEVARDSVNDLSDVVKGQYLDWSLAAGSPAGVLKLLDQLEAARARVAELEAAQGERVGYAVTVEDAVGRFIQFGAVLDRNEAVRRARVYADRGARVVELREVRDA